ncbi:ABC transporter ATP-binding protein [Stieleria varia]|uniref:Teichoic acids export ATP-binding protein TagH n=1 Tax=Stieleria varia TaxID=2528005 RepID=A0A5C6B3V8_9BACT|nr:ABC transporter ATP-binding protein [Stieleria varia]TWU05966.1 Teichoic acids export ATP-binding protein TagH [Stieleria varia]
MNAAIKIENVSKLYRLGQVGTGTLSHDLNRWWHTIRGKDDPYAKVGQVNDRTKSTAKNQEPGTKNETTPDYVWALRDISVDVAQGEILGIIGRNGAGKSTLLKLLSRVTAPTEGCIKTKGRIASLLEVGTGFHPELTGRENVYLNGAILGMKRHEITGQLDSIVDFSGCAKYLDTPTKRYSSGMMVRLGFAVAAHLQCEILIVDEVLAVGDVEFQRQCLGRMKSVAQSGKTVLFVSHNLASIRSLTERCVVLSKGGVAFDGSTDQAVSRYIKENLVTDESPVSIANAPRPFGGLDRHLEFVDLKLQGLSEDRSLSTDQPFVLDATIRANEEAGPFILGLTIYAEDKTPIGSAFTTPVAAPAVGSTATTQFQAQFPLGPGQYHCAVSISEARSEGKRLHDSLADVLPFSITLSATDLRGWNSAWGAIQLPNLQDLKLGVG